MSTITERIRPDADGAGDLDFAQAVQGHLDWLWEINRLLLQGGDIPADLIAPDSDRRCRFARWLHGRARQALDGERLQRVTESHRALHQAATALLECHCRHQPTETAYARFSAAAIGFNTLLTEIERESGARS